MGKHVRRALGQLDVPTLGVPRLGRRLRFVGFRQMSDTNFQQRLRDVSITAIATVIGAILALIGVYVTGWFSYASKDEELRVHLVEIALGVLRADPKDTGLTPVREWAMDIIDRNSGVHFSQGARQALSNHQIPAAAPGGIGGVAPSADGGSIVCYLDANGKCVWVHLPKGASVEPNP